MVELEDIQDTASLTKIQTFWVVCELRKERLRLAAVIAHRPMTKR
jgi:hypothetical protein